MAKRAGRGESTDVVVFVGLYCRTIALERTIVTRIAEVEFPILLLGAFLRATCVEDVDYILFARMKTSCNGGGSIVRVPLLSIKE